MTRQQAGRSSRIKESFAYKCTARPRNQAAEQAIAETMSQAGNARGRTNPPGNDESSESEEDRKACALTSPRACLHD